MRCPRLTYSWLLIFAVLFLWGCAANKGPTEGAVTSGEIKARIELAESYIANADYRRSLQELMVVEAHAGNNPRYHYDLGLTYMGLKEFGLAIEALTRAVDLVPEYGQAWNLLGQAYLAVGETDKGIEAFETSMGLLSYLTPEYPAYNLARLYQGRGQSDEAMAHARMAIDKNWRFTPAYLLLAELLLDQGKTEEAIDVLTRGAEADPENTELLLRLAENHLRLGNTAEARKWFQNILNLAPESDAAQVAEDYLDLMR